MHHYSCRARLLKDILVCLAVFFVLFWLGSYNHESGSTNSAQRRLEPEQCQKERHNIVYIKMVKGGSSTMNTIFHTFGYVRNLSFVLPVKDKLYLGWPFQISPAHFRPPINGSFNILSEHSVFNKTTMSNFMPKDTVYVTSIREPFAHFKSVYNYYQVGKVSKAGQNVSVSKFLRNAEHFDLIFKSHDRANIRMCVPDNFSMTRNLQSYILGVPLGYPPGRLDLTHQHEILAKYVQKQINQFNLVIVLEYLDESLVLLKRLMCWQLRDILYKPALIANYIQKNEHAKVARNIHRKWSNADYILYDYAKKTLWQKMHKAGFDFKLEVIHFKKMHARAREFCIKGIGERIFMPGSRWNSAFYYTRHECNLLDTYLLPKIKEVYDSNARHKSISEQPELKSEFYC